MCLNRHTVCERHLQGLTIDTGSPVTRSRFCCSWVLLWGSLCCCEYLCVDWPVNVLLLVTLAQKDQSLKPKPFSPQPSLILPYKTPNLPHRTSTTWADLKFLHIWPAYKLKIRLSSSRDIVIWHPSGVSIIPLHNVCTFLRKLLDTQMACVSSAERKFHCMLAYLQPHLDMVGLRLLPLHTWRLWYSPDSLLKIGQQACLSLEAKFAPSRKHPMQHLHSELH